jgi:uncharacterized glyoxalase superfamily protein PhnB
MTDTNVQTTQVLYPALRYTDAHAAIDWLVAAFGFERQVVYEGPDNTVAHAQITLDGAVLMLGSAREGGVYPGKTPAQLGGITGSLYVYVTDPDAHCARAPQALESRWNRTTPSTARANTPLTTSRATGGHSERTVRRLPVATRTGGLADPRVDDGRNALAVRCMIAASNAAKSSAITACSAGASKRPAEATMPRP